MIWVSLLPIAIITWVFIKSQWNAVYGIGPIYWIKRDIKPNNTPFLCKGFMRETDAPWRVGTGIQLAISHYTLQIGRCKAQDAEDDDEGLLAALQGTYMDASVSKIREWK